MQPLLDPGTPALRVAADARQREPRARRQAERLERLLDEPRRLDLFEAELGVTPDLLPEPDDLRATPVDRLPHPPLQLVFRHRRSPFIGLAMRPHDMLRLARPLFRTVSKA